MWVEVSIEVICTPEMLQAAAAVARGESPADLLVTGGRVVNVFTGEVASANVACAGGVIAGVGSQYTAGETVLDAGGAYLIPGLIDAHLHVESTLLMPAELARAVISRGTTALVCDPHEIANVLGLAGVELMLTAAAGLPVDFFFTAPSCVPATPLETAGGAIGPRDVEKLLEKPQVVGLGEMMNYPGAIAGEAGVAAMICAAANRGKALDGHAPGVTGIELQAYAGAGLSTDHEVTGAAEALEKVRAGMTVIIRQGSAARNLEAVLPAVTERNCASFMFGCDDREAGDLLERGHLDAVLREAVALGLDPVLAVRLATLNPARHYRLGRRGALAPGYRADLVVVEDLHDFAVRLTVKDGKVAARQGEAVLPPVSFTPPPAALHTVRLARLPEPADFTLEAPPGAVPVIGLIPGEIITAKLILEPRRGEGGAVLSDPERDILKIAVLERHRGSGGRAVGLVRGLGLKTGALASSVAHDSHNIIVVGVEEKAMAAAAAAVAQAGGGFAAAGAGGEVLALLPLPVAGLMSLEPAATVAAGVRAVNSAARSLGTTLDQPFLALSFLALPVIPHLKITDRGLVDVGRFSFI